MKRMQGFTRSSSPATTTPASRLRTSSRSSSRRRDDAAGARARGVRGARLGLAARVRRHDHGAVPPHRRLARLLRASGSRWTTPTSRAVMRFFVHLWDRKGWIYRANRIVNWCPFHETSLSDLEVAHAEIDDTLTYVAVSARGRLGPPHDRDRPPGDDPRATSPSPCILTTSATATRSARRSIVPFVERARAGDRRRARRAGLRNGRAEDHARARSDGLRDRPRPRAAGPIA